MAIIYLGLGSNIGDRKEKIQSAVTLLADNGIKVIRISSMIETDPVGGPPQGLFFNAVLKAESSLTPVELLDICQAIEKKLGRVPGVRNGPRTIDIDILLYDDLKLNTPNLTIPHPRMFEREFVMIPLKEIDGE